MARDIVREVMLGAREVHAAFGDGFAEKIYEEAMMIELGLRGVHVERNFPINVVYKEHILDGTYAPDLVADGRVLVEIKTLKDIRTIDDEQLLHYLRVANLPVALLINFGRVLEMRMSVWAAVGPPTPGEVLEPGVRRENPETI